MIRVDVAARVAWVAGFLAALIAAVAIVGLLLGPGWLSIAVAMTIWLGLMAVVWMLIRSGVGAAMRRWS